MNWFSHPPSAISRRDLFFSPLKTNDHLAVLRFPSRIYGCVGALSETYSSFFFSFAFSFSSMSDSTFLYFEFRVFLLSFSFLFLVTFSTRIMDGGVSNENQGLVSFLLFSFSSNCEKTRHCKPYRFSSPPFWKTMRANQGRFSFFFFFFPSLFAGSGDRGSASFLLL